MFSTYTGLYHELNSFTVTDLLRQTLKKWYVINPIRKDNIFNEEQMIITKMPVLLSSHFSLSV